MFTGGKGHFDRLSLVASAEQIRETLKLDATIYYALEKKRRVVITESVLERRQVNEKISCKIKAPTSYSLLLRIVEIR